MPKKNSTRPVFQFILLPLPPQSNRILGHKMDNPLITFIIPAYNTSRYLPQCLKSVTRQSYRNLEILVIDDGSTDATGSIAQEWAARDERIRVIHQPNGGLSSARNTGLDAAQGQLLACLDSDDYLAPNYAERLLQVMNDTGADIASAPMMPFDDGHMPEPTVPQPGHVRTYSSAQALQAIFYQQHGLTHSAWGKLYRREVFQGVRYPVGLIYEDLATITPLMANVKLLAQTSESLYYYRQRSTSILGKFSLKRTDVLNIMDSLVAQAEQQRPELAKAVRSRKLSANLNLLRLMPLDDPQYEPVRERCWQNVKQLRAECLLDPRTRLRNKAASLLSYLGQSALLRAINHR